MNILQWFAILCRNCQLLSFAIDATTFVSLKFTSYNNFMQHLFFNGYELFTHVKLKIVIRILLVLLSIIVTFLYSDLPSNWYIKLFLLTFIKVSYYTLFWNELTETISSRLSKRSYIEQSVYLCLSSSLFLL